MMKKIFYFSLMFAAVTGVTSCNNEEADIFNASAAERLNTASALYSARLTAQPNGWAMQYYPTYDDEEPNGAGYLLLNRFNKDYTVDVSGYNWPTWSQIYNSDQGSTEWVLSYTQQYYSFTSFWRVITDNGPVLTFDTYNDVLHLFSDPDNHETGTGFGGDYEFIIVDAPEDASYMMLKGKKRGTYNLLTPIEEGVEYESYLTDVRNFQSKMFSENSPTGVLLVMGDSIYNMEDAGGGLPSIYPIGTDKVTYENFNPFLITKRGEDYYLRFRDELVKGENAVREFKYSKEEDIFKGVDNNNCYIRGDSIGRFFINSLFESGFRWEWNGNSDMSEQFAQIYNAIQEGFSTVLKYTLKNMSWRVNSNILTFRMQYQNGRNIQNVDYDFEFVRHEDDITFKFIQDHAKSAGVAREKIKAIQTIIDMMGKTWILKGGETQFDLNLLKLVQKENTDMWITLTMTR